MRSVVTLSLACRWLFPRSGVLKSGRSFRTHEPRFRKVLPPDWNRRKRAEIISNWVKKMANAGDAAALALQPLRDAVKEQGDLVRSLKEANAPENDLKAAVSVLKARKKVLETKEAELAPLNLGFERTKMEDLLKRRFFYDISFSIYGGQSGQFDMGPMGCAMKTNLLQVWRNHFILEENLLEVDCTILTPERVLKASGHVDRFVDVMVKDLMTGECHRLDHLIENNLKKRIADGSTTAEKKAEYESVVTRLNGSSREELNQLLRTYDMKSPTTGNSVSDGVDFNLMFGTTIGPGEGAKAFLRPETAQGIFVNFNRLLEFNQGKLPFGVAQIGNSFRNEISPRAGLIRVREFTMAEIEYFLDPSLKDHDKFDAVKDMKLSLYSACDQMVGKSTGEVVLSDAVAQKLIANETLAYFMARIHLFLVKVGVDPARLRFRQHMSHEMAHYACDCWDAEIFTSYGWTECVGCADRSCYDLTQHTLATGLRLSAEKPLAEPRTVRVRECLPNKAVIGQKLKGQAKELTAALRNLSLEQVDAIDAAISSGTEYPLVVNDQQFILTEDMVVIKDEEKTVHVEEVTPSVIEPSFGIGRIMYSIWEHNFKQREGDEQRTFLSLPAVIAPYKCSILPLISRAEFVPFIKQVSADLKRRDVSHKIDVSAGSVGRRYSRTDEIAIPFGITLDFDTLSQSPPSATLRERDSCEQVRIALDEIAAVVQKLSQEKMTWADVRNAYPLFVGQESAN